MDVLHNLRSIPISLGCEGAFSFHKIYLKLVWKQVDKNTHRMSCMNVKAADLRAFFGHGLINTEQ